jgi:hypothetical protein
MSDRPPEAVLWDCLRGAMVTKALAAVVDAGIPEHLADGPRPVSELGGRRDTTYRLLRALASDGVFREEEPGVFAHTEASRLLLAPSWAAFAHLFGGVFYESVADLAAGAESPTFPHRFGADFWEWLREQSEERALFDTAMAGGKQRTAERLGALPWHEGEVVVDVGGGNGALLLELLERRPELRGIVLDLPETVRDDDALAARGIEFVEGSFFETAPPADAYVLSQILHDWSDDDAARILRTLRAAAPLHARLLITESVIAAGNEPHGAKWLDLLMFAVGGRERTEGDWRFLLESTGFEPVSIEDGLIQARCG